MNRHWYQILDLNISSLKAFKSYLLSYFPNITAEEILWIVDEKSPYLYHSRWKPILIFLKLTKQEAAEFDTLFKQEMFGRLARDNNKFAIFSDAQVSEFHGSKFNPALIGKKVKILNGPLEDFYGKTVGYDEAMLRYDVEVKLLKTCTIQKLSLNHLVFLE